MTNPRKIRKSWFIIIVLLIVLVFNQIPLPYFYSQPGEATSLKGMITVEEGNQEDGSFYLTTIRQRRANIPLYVWAQLSPYREIVPTHTFMREEETDEEYFHRQAMMMKSAQEASKIAAYDHADFSYEIEYKGIRVTQVVEGMDAENHLKSGDLITALNDGPLETLEELNRLLEDKEKGEEVELTIEREDETITETVEMDVFPEDLDSSGKTGLGILYPFTERDVHFEPDVTINAGEIGGPSAGLMFALEIYNQLTETDLTGGLDIAGTGTIDDEGNVGRIGGIDKKVVAAHQSGADIFFAPDDDVAEPSNYKVAKETADEIETEMKIVPVKHFTDALEYLEEQINSEQEETISSS